MKRTSIALGFLALLLAIPSASSAQNALQERAVRRDVPLTNMIRNACGAGARDSTGAPGANYWQLEVSYSIDARLDIGVGAIFGRETVTVENNSPDALDRIVLRLDQNVYAENAVRSRAVPDITGGTVVSAISVNGFAVDLALQPQGGGQGRGQARSPENNYVTGLNTTSATLRLKDPIPAHGSVTLAIDWSFEVPSVTGGRGLRMGAWGDSLVQVAQWYPQVAKYDDLRGWDTDPYLGGSEFYNNFGSFDVRLDVPADWTVGATGLLQNPDEVLSSQIRKRLSHVMESDATLTIVGETDFGAGKATATGDRLVWHFVADYVNDFAWAASDQYIWQATRVDIPGAETIPFYWMYLPGHAAGFEGADERGRHALQFYPELWMPYAFPILTMADGPDTGMEYPMFIMSALGAEEVQRAMSEYAKAWRFKHPSPWDYMFSMNASLGQDLGWFWNYWLFTTESVDGSMANFAASGGNTAVTVRQDGQMPAPVVLSIQFRGWDPSVASILNAEKVGENEVLVTFPVDVWFTGSKSFQAELPFALDGIETITLDPNGRFPDRDPSDNAWPRVPSAG